MNAQTTGIGSLPYREVNTALDAAFAVDIPYFPTLPQLGASESMLKHDLQGFPGLFWKTGGEPRFESAAWERGREVLAEGLGRAFNRNHYLDYLPASTAGVWENFIARLHAHPGYWAKVQLVGPLTAMLSLHGLEGLGEDKKSEVVALLSEWLFVKALAMCAGLRMAGKEVLFLFDEPGLSTAPAGNALIQALAQLRERINELGNYGYHVGVHCCGKFDAATMLQWPAKVLSFDTALMLEDILKEREALQRWRAQGGRLILGLVPTQLGPTWDLMQTVKQCQSSIVAALGEAEAKVLLSESILSPACGLGLRTIAESEQVFADLQEVKRLW